MCDETPSFKPETIAKRRMWRSPTVGETPDAHFMSHRNLSGRSEPCSWRCNMKSWPVRLPSSSRTAGLIAALKASIGWQNISGAATAWLKCGSLRNRRDVGLRPGANLTSQPAAGRARASARARYQTRCRVRVESRFEAAARPLAVWRDLPNRRVVVEAHLRALQASFSSSVGPVVQVPRWHSVRPRAAHERESG